MKLNLWWIWRWEKEFLTLILWANIDWWWPKQILSQSCFLEQLEQCWECLRYCWSCVAIPDASWNPGTPEAHCHLPPTPSSNNCPKLKESQLQGQELPQTQGIPAPRTGIIPVSWNPSPKDSNSLYFRVSQLQQQKFPHFQGIPSNKKQR